MILGVYAVALLLMWQVSAVLGTWRQMLIDDLAWMAIRRERASAMLRWAFSAPTDDERLRRIAMMVDALDPHARRPHNSVA